MNNQKKSDKKDKTVQYGLAIAIVLIIIIAMASLYFFLWNPSSYQASIEMNVVVHSNDTEWVCLVPLPINQTGAPLLIHSDFNVVQGNPMIETEYINNEPYLKISSTVGGNVEIQIQKELGDIELFHMSEGLIDNTLSGIIIESDEYISAPSYLQVGNTIHINLQCKLSLRGFLYGSHSEFNLEGDISPSISRITGTNHKWSTE